MSLLIKNGEIVTASERYVADIWCDGETIRRIERDIQPVPGAEVIDARGKYVFPGFIDPHTHIYLPFMGTFSKDNYETASRAALIGGTTCFIDFCIPGQSEAPRAAFETWEAQSAGRSACDFTYHMAVTHYDRAVAEQLRHLVASEGLTSFKVFLAYKGALGVSDEELFGTLTLAKQLGVITTAHCENADAVLELQRQLLAQGKTGPEWHYHSRPPIVEAEGTGHLMTFASLTGAHVYVVHLSCKEALDEALRAKANGVNAWIETLIQYLLIDKSYAERPGFEGAKYVMSPPLRERGNQEILWNALRQRFISTLATDHAPFDFGGQKVMGKGDFTKIPNGIPALEDRVNLLYTAGVKEGRIDLHTFVDCASTQAAKIFGLYPRKGTIQIGADADLVVYDPKFEGTISAKRHAMNIDYNAFEGFSVHGRPQVVTVRGEVAVRDGKFVGTVGRGRRLRREPTH
ncbi:MAG: dihydropyrimidinase [Planctomycetota bacterium]